MKTTCLAFIFAFTLSILSQPAESMADVHKKNASVMGTVLEMTIDAASRDDADRVFDSIEREMDRVEQEMSEWQEDSPLSEVNRLAGIRPVKVPQELFNVISAAQQVSGITNGAFDITWAAMRGLWDFRPGLERMPKPEEVREKLRLVDYREVFLDRDKGTVLLKSKGMAIGLGGIAKGYSVDKAMETAIKAGVANAVIKAGGDIRVQGHLAGKGWTIGIQEPRDRERLLAKLTLSNVSISTSGDYERFFIKDGVLYHHIMDPKTGYPARGVRSVTVIGPDTMTTDALSTAIFVLGPEKGARSCREARPDRGYYSRQRRDSSYDKRNRPEAPKSSRIALTEGGRSTIVSTY